MAVISSQLDPQGDDFQRNREALLAQLAEVRGIQQRVVDKSYEEKPKFDKRGQLLPHERVQRLLDAGSPFIELCGLAR